MPAPMMPRPAVPGRSPEASLPPWQTTSRTPRSARAERDTNRRTSPEWRARLERRVRAEFEEMPGMRLSLVQAQRLFGLRQDICARILDSLVQEGYLCTTGNAVYARRQLE